jgi:RNA polymerase sigma-70 factor (ECF subfamily)
MLLKRLANTRVQAAVHAEAPPAAATESSQIVGLYDALLLPNPSSVVELRRAVTVAVRDGRAGPTLIDAILSRGILQN